MSGTTSKRRSRARTGSRVPFRGIFGDSSEVRVLHALLLDPSHDFMKIELAEAAGVTRPSLDRVWEAFLEHGIVFETRKLGRIRTYRLNTKSPIFKDLRRLVRSLGRLVSDQVEEKAATRPKRKARKTRT